MTLWLRAYALAGRALTPLLSVHVRRRVARGKEDPARTAERFGRDPRPRPEGPLVWIHAASIGESVSILPVVERLVGDAPRLAVLLTTTTRSSATLLAARLPEGAMHAYAPFDTAPALARFLAHWRPDATVLVEQELWPLLLARAPRPRLLVNARLSARSARQWQRLPGVARWMLGRFDRIFAQSAGDAARLRALGATAVETPGNLKLAAPPLAADDGVLERLRAATVGRTVWIAASTHAPEEQWIGEADAALRRRFPSLLTVLVPRHPERADAILAALGRSDAARLSAQPTPDPATGIYVVDGFGQLGIFYRLAQVAFVGGSLVAHGGQNPLEPARLGKPVLFGPHMSNFEEAARLLVDAGGARHVERASLAEAVAAWLADPDAAAAAGLVARRAVEGAAGDAVTATSRAIRDAVLFG